VSDYDLTLGLPHTNRFGLWEPLLMMQAGHAQWQAIAEAIGKPLSLLRSRAGGEVYAAFYYIETTLPPDRPIESYGLDDTVRFRVALRAFKNLAVEGRLYFDRPERLGDAQPGDPLPAEDVPHPYIRFGNIFITPMLGNDELRVAPPANADFSSIPHLPNADNPYPYTREAKASGRLDVIDERWQPLGEPFVLERALDPDRDTNGAGLVYFANYVTYVEIADREAAVAASLPGGWSLRWRRIAYFGNASPDHAIRVRVQLFADPQRPSLRAHRCTIERSHDSQVICLTEAIKAARPSAS
jgi:probable biosynthetic protein (TIGR04098 family)